MNKQMKLFFILFVSALCLGFTSCGDDDDGTDYAKEIAGTYEGTITVLEQPLGDTAIEITRTSDNKVTLSMSLKNVLGVDDTVSATSDVLYSNNVYTVSANTTYSYLTIPLPIGITGTIDKNGNANLDVAVGQGINVAPFPLTAVFEGKRK